MPTELYKTIESLSTHSTSIFALEKDIILDLQVGDVGVLPDFNYD
jgi:hypothetical protein